MDKTLPSQAKKYFWGDDLSQLNWNQHENYITQTLLNQGDSKSISWLLKQKTSKDLLKMISSLKLTPKTRNFWKLYLS
ncbi:MAG: hypothetical protein ABIJ43_01325 [Candidatus Beckwithbacteria bacterium]|nr:hypothetical protein [Patescibacteria group bacterium]